MQKKFAMRKIALMTGFRWITIKSAVVTAAAATSQNIRNSKVTAASGLGA